MESSGAFSRSIPSGICKSSELDDRYIGSLRIPGLDRLIRSLREVLVGIFITIFDLNAVSNCLGGVTIYDWLL